MKKKPKTIEQIRADFHRSMKKVANKNGTTISFLDSDGKELGKIEPDKK